MRFAKSPMLLSWMRKITREGMMEKAIQEGERLPGTSEDKRQIKHMLTASRQIARIALILPARLAWGCPAVGGR